MNIPEKAKYYTQQYNTRADAALAELTLVRWTGQAKQARKTMACILDIPFGEDASDRLDFFPTAKSGAPLLVFIHGGWWRFLDKSDFSWVAEHFVKAGFNVALPNYGLCPKVSLKTIVEQQLKALAYLYRQSDALDFDATRIHVSGHSAGGHLTAMLCAADWSMYGVDLPRRMIRSAMPISGLYDLSPLPLIAATQADLRLSAQDVIDLSPLSYLASGVPVMAWDGGAESEEFHRQTALLASTWGKSVKLFEAPGHSHFTVLDDFANDQGLGHQAAIKFMNAA